MSKPKIFIVEDDENAHPLYKEAFEENGFEVTIAPDADGFFAERVAGIKPDIISMDLMIGKEGAPTERDGFQAIELLHSDLRTADIPIIVLSNFFQEDRVRRAKELGAVDYINIAAYALNKIPKQYLGYLKDPDHYKPLHPIFREGK